LEKKHTKLFPRIFVPYTYQIANESVNVFFQFLLKNHFYIEILVKVNPKNKKKKRKLVEFTVEKQNLPKSSQFIFGKIAKFCQKKKREKTLKIINQSSQRYSTKYENVNYFLINKSWFPNMACFL
jgi:hypothetical protein